jgi:hypothetical protein
MNFHLEGRADQECPVDQRWQNHSQALHRHEDALNGFRMRQGENRMRTYRLILSDDGHGVARRIELEARSAKEALALVSREVANRRVELQEDGKRLATIIRIPGMSGEARAGSR